MIPTLRTMKDRLRAGAVHLGLSALVALGAVAVIFLLWYPESLAQTQGVSRLVLVLIAVDVTIGPLITVLIFNRAKKSLPFDLAVIACLQLGALLYGLHAIFIARPAIIAYNVDRFDVVPALDVEPQSLEKAQAAGKPGLPWWGPRIVYAQLPDDREARTSLLFSAAIGGPDLPQMAEWYEPYAEGREVVVKRARPLAELRDINGMDAQTWTRFIESFGRTERELAYLPLRAKIKDGAVIVDAHTAEILRITLLEPKWD